MKISDYVKNRGFGLESASIKLSKSIKNKNATPALPKDIFIS